MWNLTCRCVLSKTFGGYGAKCLFSRAVVVIDIKHSYSSDSPTVQTKQGLLAGAIRKNIDGGQFIAFMGVPYAEQPVGKLRFKVSYILRFIFHAKIVVKSFIFLNIIFYK